VRHLFTGTYEYGIEKCFLVEMLDSEQEPSLGIDPEFPLNEQNLKEVKWHSLKSMKNDIHVSEILKVMPLKEEEADSKV
jgi:hypothetical protein